MNLFSLPYLQLSIAVHGINGQKPSGSVLLVAKLRWEDYIIHCGWEFRQWSVTCQVGVSPVYWWVISMTSPDAPNSGFPQRVWPRFVWLSKSHKPRVGKALSHAQNTNLGQHFFSEQATVGVRKLQHFLCKDPKAYGATGQNWIPFLSAVHWLNALCHSKHCCTVVYRPCF